MKKNILFVTMLLGTMVACKKESTSTPTESAADKAKKVLMAGDWVIESNSMAIGNGPFIPVPIEDCQKDDYARYTSNKQIVFNGTEKCDSEELASDTSSYSFNTKADSITFSDNGESFTYGYSYSTSGQVVLTMSSTEIKQKLILKRK